MRELWIDPPRVSGDRIEVSWRVEPATELYRRTTFFLRFPPPVDVAAFPERLRWLVALLCLHPHWALLRPCRIHLPVRLGSGEAELWLRLVDASVITLQAHRGGSDHGRSVDLVEHGQPLPFVAPLPERGRCAAAFSGGKDSLLQAGLLAELATGVMLVNTCSPMPPLHDHLTDRRRHVLREIVARRPGLPLIEVESDLRAAWRNDFPPTVGYQVAVNELTDTFLYLAALLGAAWSAGATHLFLASEAEVQENVEIDGVVVQHPHAMYSVVTQSAVSALLAPLGIRYGSLLSPLRSQQIQQLLWQRYPDLADLQYSCWRVAIDEATCSSCSQCLRIAFAALAIGEWPQRMGIDLVKLIGSMRQWQPRHGERSLLPGDRVAAELHAQTVRTIVATSVRRFAAALRRDGRLYTPRGLLAVDRFRRLRSRLQGESTASAPGYRPVYLVHVDPLLRDALAAIYADSFPAEETAAHDAMRKRGERLAAWIAEPLEEPSFDAGVA